jgi:sec-independent protein translocase protein TatA
MLSGLENPFHLLIIFLIVLLLVGAKRLPEVGRGLGGGMRGFKDALTNPESAPNEAATTGATIVEDARLPPETDAAA